MVCVEAEFLKILLVATVYVVTVVVVVQAVRWGFRNVRF